MRKRPFAWALIALMALACRSTRPAPDEQPMVAIVQGGETGEADVSRELAARLQTFAGERSLLRLRASAGDRTQSFRAQLQVDRDRRMLLTAYTPLGTTALRIYAEAGWVTFLNDIESTWWRGSATELARTFPFFASLDPSTMALILLGLAPAGSPVTYELGPGGLRSARLSDATVSFDPAVYPPKHVSVRTPAGQLDIEHLESLISPGRLQMPEIPKTYRCCVPPAL